MLDIQDGNIMLSIRDTDVLDALVEDEWDLPSARKIIKDRVIYASTGLEIPDEPGDPVIADFGDARIDEGPFEFEEEVMPDVYRAPEIVLGVPWNEKIDIWALGLLTTRSNGIKGSALCKDDLSARPPAGRPLRARFGLENSIR
ncbi:hypothetical protein N0V92_000668 [Colletotrichum tropicale]|nr:hypothetical protein N0V92_000668 [Colletotrichum tropicale]